MITANDYTPAEMVDIQTALFSKHGGTSAIDGNPLVESWVSKDSAQHWRALATRASNPEQARIMAETAREFDERAEEQLTLARKLTKLNQEAVTMTTTPTTSQRPPIPATVPESKSPALIAVENLEKKIEARYNSHQSNLDAALLRLDYAEKQMADLRAQVTHLEAQLHDANEMTRKIYQAVVERTNAPAPAQSTAPTADTHGDGTIEIMQGVEVRKGVNEKNSKITIKITTTDPRFSQYGVTVWPEKDKALGIDRDSMPFGAKPFEKKIKVSVDNGKSQVIGLA